MRWYAIFVVNGKEEEVKRLIYERLGRSTVELCVPKRKVPEKRNGIFYDSIRIVFPSYVFIHTTMCNDVYYKIRQIPNVIALLNFRNKKDILHSAFNEEDNYRDISDREMEFILRILNDEEIIEYSYILLRNEKVAVISGPLKGLEGRIKKIDKHKKRAKLQLDFLGGEKLIDIGVEFIRSKEPKAYHKTACFSQDYKLTSRQKVETLIAGLLCLPKNTAIENNFRNCGVNSLIYTKLIVDIEEEFGITVLDQKLYYDQFTNIDEIVEYIDSCIPKSY
jgi:transcription antitermination factor NusG/acyl carrier protein